VGFVSPNDSPQRSNIRFGQTQPFAIHIHPLIALDAAVKSLTPSIDFDFGVTTDGCVLFF
jgi:hypothetical protein